MRKRTQAREYALQIIYHHEMNSDKLENIFPIFWNRYSEAEPDVRDFAENLVKKTLVNREKIDQLVEKYTDNWELSRMVSVDRNILRLATAELLYFEDIPPKVTINEAVNIAKKFSQEESGKFVNGVLDKIIHTEKLPKSDSHASPSP